MSAVLSSKAVQHILETTRRDGHYAGTHGGLNLEIDVYSIPNSAKLGVSLKVCLERKWKTFPVETIEAAVEMISQLLNEKSHKREVKQETLWGGIKSLTSLCAVFGIPQAK